MSDIIRQMAARCCNWGKWGPDDERGTLNYITPEMIARAATLAKRGAVFSLAVPFNAGMEVRPNEIPDTLQPLHQVFIPAMGC